MCWCAIKKLLTHPTRSIVCLYRIDDGIDVAAKQKAEQKLSDGEKSLRAGGLVPSDSWADNTPVKKVQRTDSQKKEKRQRTLSLKTNKKMAVAQGQVQELYNVFLDFKKCFFSGFFKWRQNVVDKCLVLSPSKWVHVFALVFALSF